VSPHEPAIERDFDSYQLLFPSRRHNVCPAPVVERPSAPASEWRRKKMANDGVEVHFTWRGARAGESGLQSIPSIAGTVSNNHGSAGYPCMGLKIDAIERDGELLPVDPENLSIGLVGFYFTQNNIGQETDPAFNGEVAPPYDAQIGTSLGLSAFKIVLRGRDKDRYTVTYGGTANKFHTDTGVNDVPDNPPSPEHSENWMGILESNDPRIVYWLESFWITIEQKPNK
jgi:hypothetical protein